MTPFPDLGYWAIELLKGTTAITDRLFGGADSVLEAGELTAKWLEEQQFARREAVIGGDVDAASKVLDLLVWDGGERPWRDGWASYFGVYVHDRTYGYRNIRALRSLLVSTLIGKPVFLDRDAVVVRTWFSGRSGYQVFEKFDLDFELLSFMGPLTIQGDVYIA